jgi:hypothetical protein
VTESLLLQADKVSGQRGLPTELYYTLATKRTKFHSSVTALSVVTPEFFMYLLLGSVS